MNPFYSKMNDNSLITQEDSKGLVKVLKQSELFQVLLFLNKFNKKVAINKNSLFSGNIVVHFSENIVDCDEFTVKIDDIIELIKNTSKFYIKGSFIKYRYIERINSTTIECLKEVKIERKSQKIGFCEEPLVILRIDRIFTENILLFGVTTTMKVIKNGNGKKLEFLSDGYISCKTTAEITILKDIESIKEYKYETKSLRVLNELVNLPGDFIFSFCESYLIVTKFNESLGEDFTIFIPYTKKYNIN
ncbi:hypothetical protein NUSPORA_00853 [Nucleospora cyclopteri]